MGLLIFLLHKYSLLSRYLAKHISVVTINPRILIPIAYHMVFDKISPSGWYQSKAIEGDLPVDYFRYRTLELLSMEIKRKKLIGSIAEVGVFRGNFSAVMNEVFPTSKLYLFDTFEGFSDVDFDYEVVNGYTDKKAIHFFKNTSEEIVLSKMKHAENCVIKKGYFPDSLDNLEDKFIFVSLDCDLYKPILAGLEYFYPRLVKGGYIMIHDYNGGTNYWKGCKEAIYEYERKYGELQIIPIPDKDGSIILTK